MSNQKTDKYGARAWFLQNALLHINALCKGFGDCHKSWTTSAGNPGEGTPESDPSRRALNPAFAPAGSETGFTDKMPFLLTNEVCVLLTDSIHSILAICTLVQTQQSSVH